MLYPLAVAALLASFTQAAPLDTLTLTNISHWGTGCPQDSSVSVSTSGNSINAKYPSFAVTTTPQDQTSQFCGLAVTIAAPASWQFSAASTSYRDEINVGSGTTGSHIMTYAFQG
ncbi:putative secreted protein, partial [Lachnellula suecica]